jgi:hypothetical protein
MRRLVAVAAITAGMLLTPAAPALALGQPHRPTGFDPFPGSVNGHDNGFGNCGHNSSGGVAPLAGGNGGLVDVAKANLCAPPTDNDPGGDDGGGIT